MALAAMYARALESHTSQNDVCATRPVLCGKRNLFDKAIGSRRKQIYLTLKETLFLLAAYSQAGPPSSS